jgi:hypothetical protein
MNMDMSLSIIGVLGLFILFWMAMRRKISSQGQQKAVEKAGEDTKVE